MVLLIRLMGTVFSKATYSEYTSLWFSMYVMMVLSEKMYRAEVSMLSLHPVRNRSKADIEKSSFLIINPSD